MLISAKYLRNHKNEVFVFGDNVARKGKKGAATLRDEPNTYGFITKRYPSNSDKSFYKSLMYKEVYKEEIKWLMRTIANNPDKTFLISQIGAGLANRYKIFEEVIEPNIKKDLEKFENVKFLW